MGASQSAPVTIPTTTRATVELRPSQIDSAFPAGRHRGLFTMRNQTRGQWITLDEARWANDPLVDLRPVLAAKTSVAMYNALSKLAREYSPDDRINLEPAGDHKWVITKNVPKGTELCRGYSFSTWLLEIQQVLTEATLPGYVYWVIRNGKEICIGPHKLLWDSLNWWGVERLSDYYNIEVTSPWAFDATALGSDTPVTGFNYGAIPIGVQSMTSI